MAFQQGLSGLSAASKSLDVISNNVANSGNVGFKSASTLFNDVFASALSGAAANVQVGVGTNVGAVAQEFSQGNIAATNNPLDIAINGGGFFRLSDQGGIAYSRNGQFDVDKDGFIVNAGNRRLTGYPADESGTVQPAAPIELRLDTSDLPPKASTAIEVGINLDSRDTVPANAFSATDASSFNASTAVTVFDSLGNPHILTMFFRKSGGGEWDMHTSLDGDAAVLSPDKIRFNGAGALTAGGAQALTLTIPAAFGADSPQAVTLDFTGSSQYGSAFGVNRQTQDGFASGRLSGMTVSSEGILQGRYTNGQSRNLGQVALTNFASPNGLVSLGNNLWGESPDSGQPLVGAPGTGSLGVLAAGSVEESNVDLTEELVNMITQQRAYQANAQTIKTQDQILQTLVNLR